MTASKNKKMEVTNEGRRGVNKTIKQEEVKQNKREVVELEKEGLTYPGNE